LTIDFEDKKERGKLQTVLDHFDYREVQAGDSDDDEVGILTFDLY
jgi:hypothetical protein